MTDKYLLELAAKAAGIEVEWLDSYTAVLKNGMEWNPLTDDGDALRLAVKLCAIVGAYANFSTVDLLHPNGRIETTTVGHHETYADSYAATRRAIVRAAAEIGETL